MTPALLVGLAVASAAPRVSVDAVDCDGALVERTQRELDLDGFELAEAELLREGNAVDAALVSLRCLSAEAKVLVRIEAASRQRAAERWLQRGEVGLRDAVVAYTVVEMVRALLAEVSSPGVVAEHARRERRTSPPPSRPWRVDLAAGVMSGMPLERMQASLLLAVARRVGPLEVGASFVATVEATQVTGVGGWGDVWLGVLRATVAWPLAAGELTLRPSLGFGGFFASLLAHAEPGYVPTDTVYAALSPSASVSLAVPLFTSLDFTASAGVGLSFPGLAITFADGGSFIFGWPYLFSTIGLTYR